MNDLEPQNEVIVLRAAIVYGNNGLPLAGRGAVDAVERVLLREGEFETAAAALLRRGLLRSESGRLYASETACAEAPRSHEGTLSYEMEEWLEWMRRTENDS